MTKKQVQAAEPARSFEIEVPALRAALADVAGVVEKRNTIPVLSNVLMVVTPSALTLTATDLEAWGAVGEIEDIARAFVQAVYNETASTRAGGIARQILALFGIR